VQGFFLTPNPLPLRTPLHVAATERWDCTNLHEISEF